MKKAMMVFIFLVISMFPFAESSEEAGLKTVNKASELVGMNVKNLLNEDIGEVVDLVIDMDTGRVAYAVLSTGGFIGFGERLFAIPPKVFKFSANEDHLLLDVNKEKLEKAPGFNKDNWPDRADRKWAEDVYTYYGQKYYTD
jgi:sporulation protein YlmC with PRC-barrel domain